MSQQISREASIPLQQHRRGNRLVEFALILTIGFAATSLLKLEPLARNSVQNQNHNGKFDLPQPQSNHSMDMQQFQSGMPLLSSNNTSTTVESLDRDHQDQDDADNSENDSESCLRPRRNSDAAVKSPLKLPFINLGMPKMGSTSLHTYFQCGGYESIHWECGKSPTMRGKRLFCADCIKSAIQAGLPPFSECNSNINKTVASYAQIDRGPENLVQVNYLNEIVGGVPNATFILTFRNMTKWYMSLTNWQSIYSEFNMRNRFQRANLIGLPTGVGRNVSEFRNFYCEYVTRVREEVAKYPGRHTLIEIDIEDPKVGWQLEEVFGVNRTCWGKKNTAKHNDKVSKEELQR